MSAGLGGGDLQARDSFTLRGAGNGGPRVTEGLLAVLDESGGLGRPLHLDDAAPRPDQINEAAGLRLLERGDLSAILAVASEELAQERLGLGALRPLVHAPAFRERYKPLPDLLARQRQIGADLTPAGS